ESRYLVSNNLVMAPPPAMLLPSALANLISPLTWMRMPNRAASKPTSALVVLIGLLAEGVCHAGMPSFTLREIYRLRFQELSFFVVLLFACALLFQLTWNYAGKGFSAIPRMN